jgi:hypothetical protein
MLARSTYFGVDRGPMLHGGQGTRDARTVGEPLFTNFVTE